MSYGPIRMTLRGGSSQAWGFGPSYQHPGVVSRAAFAAIPRSGILNGLRKDEKHLPEGAHPAFSGARFDSRVFQEVAMLRHLSIRTALAALLLGSLPALALAAPCNVPDNGGGTVDLPPVGCAYLSPADVHEIIDGLPAGTTVRLGALHSDFIVRTRLPGGPLGGEQEQFDSFLLLQLTGTGTLAGWTRSLSMQVQCQTALAPRVPGPVQSFDTEMFALQGQLPGGDPDFDLLRITAGNGFGLPSPGHTTLTQLPGNQWNVDSFFDIEYRIDFIGNPGGHVPGMSGSTTATIRMVAGNTPVSIQGKTWGEIKRLYTE